ncbi:MAG: tripartite tricarboxylate transporter TctB family protein [Xanthobacteraceae bacterium]
MSEVRANDGRVRGHHLGALALMGMAVVFIWRSVVDLPLGTIDNPGPAAMPLLIAALLALFALWNLTGLVDRGDNPAGPGGIGHAVRVIAAIVVAALALGPLGYRLTILSLLVFFLGVVERKSIITVLAVSFALSFGSHALLQYVLKVPLPSGPWGL